jgi:hypothetical protein
MKIIPVLMTITCVFLLSFFPRAFCEDIPTVNWIKGAVNAAGNVEMSFDESGRPCESDGSVVGLNRARTRSYALAKETAAEKIVDRIMRVRVDSENTVSDFISQGTISQERLARIIDDRIKIVMSPSGFSSTSCRASMKISDILSSIPYGFPMERFPVGMRGHIRTEYTSLIVDVRGLGISPMILPSIYNESGLEIYGSRFVDIRYVADQGIVSYALTDRDAMENQHAGRKPYYSVALRTLKGCPVISDRDVRRVFSSDKNIEKLRKCRVIFIIDKEK